MKKSNIVLMLLTALSCTGDVQAQTAPRIDDERLRIRLDASEEDTDKALDKILMEIHGSNDDKVEVAEGVTRALADVRVISGSRITNRPEHSILDGLRQAKRDLGGDFISEHMQNLRRKFASDPGDLNLKQLIAKIPNGSIKN